MSLAAAPERLRDQLALLYAEYRRWQEGGDVSTFLDWVREDVAEPAAEKPAVLEAVVLASVLSVRNFDSDRGPGVLLEDDRDGHKYRVCVPGDFAKRLGSWLEVADDEPRVEVRIRAVDP